MTRLALASLGAAAAIGAASAFAQSFSYSENFNGLGTAGTTPPTGWSVFGSLSGNNSSWIDSTGIPAAGTPSAASGTVNNTLIVTTSPSSSGVRSSSQALNAALSTATADRCLGTSPTSQAGLILQLTLTNTATAAISQLTLGYDIRRFNAASTANELPGYRLFFSLDGGATWQNITGLNPSTSGAGGVPAVPNTVGVTSVTGFVFTLPSSWNVGSSLRLRWVDDNADQTSPDQVLGLDNVSIVASGFVSGQPPVVTLTSPVDGATFPASTTSLNLTATATDADGSVTSVTFFNGATQIGSPDLNAPYEATLTGVVPGTYTLTARAVDNLANVAVSAPVTVTVNPPPSIVAGPWSGNLTPTSATINVALSGAGISTRARLSTSPDLSNPIFTPVVVSSAAQGNSVRLDISGLTPDTTYHYAIEIDGVLQTTGDLAGRFRTFPPVGPASFRFAFGSCGSYSNASQFAYPSIVADAPLFFIHMGDMNYQDVNSTDPNAYRTVYTAQVTVGELRQVARAMGMAYMWDDHDFTGNDSNRTNIGRAASRQVYRERFPHYPLPAGSGNAAIYQTFNVGRVRFILTDLRSERDPTSLTDNASKSHLGADQKAWFKQQLLDARDAEAPLIVWNSSVPFISTNTGGDDWGRFQTERREILEFIRDQRIQNVIVISGDMHALALDDGQGSASYVSGVRVPVFHGAALAQSGSTKGGPYRVGANTVTPSQGLGRYGLIDVSDNGTNVSATYRGRIASGTGSTLTSTSDWAFVAGQTQFVFNAEPVRPRAVTGVGVAPVVGGGLQVTWTDNSGVETGQRLERRGTPLEPWSPIPLAANVTAYTDLTVPPGASAEYRLVAFNQTVEADPTAPVAGTAFTAYQNWKGLNYSNPAAPDDGDTNGNGVSVLGEYAFGLDPASASLAGLPVVEEATTPDGTRLQISFVRQRADVRYDIQATSNLEDPASWVTVATASVPVGTLFVYTDTVAPAPGRYLRVVTVYVPAGA